MLICGISSYFGHGGGEQYVRSHRIHTLPTCAATMLWGCSSGALQEMGDFDRIGTLYNYMLAGWCHGELIFLASVESILLISTALPSPTHRCQFMGCDRQGFS